MVDEPLTYVSDSMIEAKGRWSSTRTSYPITETDIRRWAMATYYPQKPPRIYWDAEYASGTRWKGIVAPPDFNPFAWTLAADTNQNLPAATASAQPRHPDGRRLIGMNGGQSDSYGVPMRPGDIITSRSRLLDWNEREGRLGHTLYMRTEVEWTNQNGVLVRTRVSTSIRY